MTLNKRLTCASAIYYLKTRFPSDPEWYRKIFNHTLENWHDWGSINNEEYEKYKVQLQKYL